MEQLLLKFRNEIRINSMVGEYDDLLMIIEKYLDEIQNKK
jgi:hypothetical protein